MITFPFETKHNVMSLLLCVLIGHERFVTSQCRFSMFLAKLQTAFIENIDQFRLP